MAEAARALLMYRFHTLGAARRRAARLGYRGALYAWESADTGDDVTPPFALAPDGTLTQIFVAAEEQHISADVAFGVWSYWHATGDDDFLEEAGAEIVLETARFWASRVSEGDDGRLHIERVIGPDEYHQHVDDNAYTNWMARWNLERGAELAERIVRRSPDHWRSLSARLDLSLEQTAEWRVLAARIYSGRDRKRRLIEQFRGYFALEDIDLRGFEARRAPMDVLLGRERIQGSQVIKQADVVMLLALLWDRLTPTERVANFRYYEPRTDHGSSLSPPIHALVAARLGDVDKAARYFRRTAEIDLENGMGNAAGGVHLAALGGLWQAAVFGFGGVRVGEHGVVADARLPPSWTALEITLQSRGRAERLALPATHALSSGAP